MTPSIKYYSGVAGAYHCFCSNCKAEFLGDKRDVTCPSCALRVAEARIADMERKIADRTLYAVIQPPLPPTPKNPVFVAGPEHKCLMTDFEVVVPALLPWQKERRQTIKVPAVMQGANELTMTGAAVEIIDRKRMQLTLVMLSEAVCELAKPESGKQKAEMPMGSRDSA